MEPSLLEPKSKEANADQFRFLWLRTFHKPVAIRITKQDSRIRLRAVRLSGAGGYEAGHMEVDRVLSLSEAEWKRLQELLDQAFFWETPARMPERSGLDGSRWILEGRMNGKYHFVNWWSPVDPSRPPSAFVHCCQYLLHLSKLQISKDEFY
jgi:hypothetical protein